MSGSEQMDWQKLMSEARIVKKGSELIVESPNKDERTKDERTEYIRDFDRITFSYHFRRLQNKTQVMPLPENDFVHNRLTHSLETSSVGRSLGRRIGNFINKKMDSNAENNDLINPENIGDIVSSACLAHDIGNPPFGHSGEDAISSFFNDFLNEDFGKSIELSNKQIADLCNYEGNAQGLRVMYINRDYPLATCATIGAFMKYPRESFVKTYKEDSFRSRKDQEKFGVFQSESGYLKEVASNLGLIKLSDGEDLAFCRHPLAFLVEAADDICYRIMDLEDGIKLKLVRFEDIKVILSDILEDPKNKLFLPEDDDTKSLSDAEIYAKNRSEIINVLIHQVVDVFQENYDSIMKGSFKSSLIEEIGQAKTLSDLKDLTKDKVYSYYPVVEIEAAGFEAIGGLLRTFLTALLTNSKSKYNKKIIQLLPKQFSKDDIKLGDNGESYSKLQPYDKIMRLVDYVCGMTDDYAISLYRKIKGTQLSKIY